MRRVWNFSAVRYIRMCVNMHIEKQISRASAAWAYFLLLSVFPLIICVNVFLSFVNLDAEKIVSYLGSLLPESTIGLIENYFEYLSGQQSKALLIAGMIMVLTTASAAYRSMMQALAEIYEEKPREGLQGLLISILFPIGLLLTIYLALGVIITGDWLMGWLGIAIPVWRYLRFLLLFFFFFFFILIISRVAVSRDAPLAPIVVGSALSSFALVAASMLFSWFISMSTRYSMIYGPLVSVVLLMTWLYLSGNMFFWGNIISSVWFQWHGKKKEGEEEMDTDTSEE